MQLLCFSKSMKLPKKKESNVGLLKQNCVLVTQLFISLKSHPADSLTRINTPTGHVNTAIETAVHGCHHRHGATNQSVQICWVHVYTPEHCVSIKTQMTIMVMQSGTPTLQNLKSWTHQWRVAWVGCAYSTRTRWRWQHSYPQLAKTDVDGQISSSAPSLRWCFPTSHLMCQHSKGTPTTCNHDDAHITLHLAHSSS